MTIKITLPNFKETKLTCEPEFLYDIASAFERAAYSYEANEMSIAAEYHSRIANEIAKQLDLIIERKDYDRIQPDGI